MMGKTVLQSSGGESRSDGCCAQNGGTLNREYTMFNVLINFELFMSQ